MGTEIKPLKVGEIVDLTGQFSQTIIRGKYIPNPLPLGFRTNHKYFGAVFDSELVFVMFMWFHVQHNCIFVLPVVGFGHFGQHVVFYYIGVVYFEEAFVLVYLHKHISVLELPQEVLVGDIPYLV